MQNRRAEVDVREGVLGVSPRLPAAGEERLECLRRELDHRVTLDDPGPPALERQLARREHAQPHEANSARTSPHPRTRAWHRYCQKDTSRVDRQPTQPSFASIARA